VVFVAVASTLGYVFWDIAMRRGDVVLVATISYFTPLVSTLIGAVYLGVRPGPRLWMGGVLLVGAAYACRTATRALAAPRAALDETHLQGE
jgi:drug/metabolite transporter (DMT)-like permease